MQRTPKSPKISSKPDAESALTAKPKKAPSSSKTDSTSAAKLSAVKKGEKTRESQKNVRVVAIGASAGGLEAIEGLISEIKPDGKFAYVIIIHLSSEYKSLMRELLVKYTDMQIFIIEDGMQINANCIYITPPDEDISIFDNKLYLIEPTKPHSLRQPISFFFKSLADEKGHESIGIILSGTGSDGTEGLRAIKERGGLSIVQSPETAKYDGMPRSAINNGIVDYVLSTREIAILLGNIEIDENFLKKNILTEHHSEHSGDDFKKILLLIRNHTGEDLTFYKTNTLLRRIDRRKGLHQIDKMSDYLNYLNQNEHEIDLLYKDMLIGVSNFFRDAEAFESLKNKTFQKIFKTKSASDPIRVWVPGCSTGEEAYTLAILFKEYMLKTRRSNPLQIFATDVNKEAIEIARKGEFSSNISADVPEDILKKYFTKDNDHFKINKGTRDTVLFSKQNVLTDPPFSRLDLISCRNLLIYLNPKAQQKVFSIFLYALNKNGFLFLGKAESISQYSYMFSVIDTKWKIYRSNDMILHPGAELQFNVSPLKHSHLPGRVIGKIDNSSRNVDEETKKILLERYSPPCVIVNEKFDIIYIHGRTGKFLEPAAGKFQNDLLQMARDGLRIPLSIALRKVFEQKQKLILENLEIKENGGSNLVDVTIEPLIDPEPLAGMVMVVFNLIKSLKPGLVEDDGTKISLKKMEHVRNLENELRSTKEYLKGIIEDLGSSNEELISMNEELQSSNEELQSSNEEMETSKEELESLNEEMVSVNTELENKIEELSLLNSDINNLMASSDIGTIFLDTKMNIKRFTPAATSFINLKNSDIGRPISDLSSKIEHSKLTGNVLFVLRTLEPYRGETQTDDGRWVDLRIMPYRTTENIVDGVIITFPEITDLKNKERDINKIRTYLNNVLATVNEPFVVIDKDLRVILANKPFLSLFKLSKEIVESMLVYDIGDKQLDIPELRKLIEKIVSKNTVLKNFEITDNFPNIGRKKMLLNARQVLVENEKEVLIFMSFTDITELSEKENLLKNEIEQLKKKIMDLEGKK